MADDRVITLRFKPECVPDMELYNRLEAEKGRLGLSMPAYVKDILRQYFENPGRMWGHAEAGICMEQVRGIVQEELASQSAELAGMIERMAESLPDGLQKKGEPSGEVLPGYSDRFPEGLNGVLKKFM